MDPASAIGAASGAITFLQASYQFVRTVYDAYDGSKPGAFESIGDVAEQMSNRASELLSQNKDLPLIKDEADIVALAHYCQTLAADIVKLVQRTKGKSGSIQTAISSAIKTLVHKGKITRFQTALENCRAQLHLQCQLLSNKQILDGLERLEQASESLQKLSNQKAILIALKEGVVDERYQNVESPATDTFEWIFTDSESQEQANSRLKIPFKDWLSSGEGIFHISGKPGSGKSTLMKFLYKHSETQSLLLNWAGDKKLVTARFFFWKPGAAIQKNIIGLVQSVLYHILSQSPDYLETCFPQHWKPSEYQALINPLKVDIERDEIFQAFDILINDQKFHLDNRICFFIDGLDEFQETFHSYGDLVTRLENWVKAASGGVKICVSSRELPPFEKRFPDTQRIRLQDLTKSDIEQFVHEKLDEHTYFQELQTRHPKDCEKLKREVVELSDGVFLWVAVVLKQLRDGFDYEETPADLLRKLYSFPHELEAFFQHILDSIPKDRRRKAYCTLAFAMESLTWTNFGEFRIFASSTTFSNLLSPACIYRYLLLDRYLDDINFAVRDIQNIKAEEIDGPIMTAASQVTGRCQSLLELRYFGSQDSFQDIFSNIDSTQMCKVVFAHRSIPEFLEEALKAERQSYLDDFDSLDAMLQTLIGLCKYVETGTDITSIWAPIRNNLAILAFRSSGIENRRLFRYFQSLDAMDEILFLRQRPLLGDVENVDWTKFPCTPSSTNKLVFLNIGALASAVGFHEYLSWKSQQNTENLRSTIGKVYLRAAIEMGSAEYTTTDIMAPMDSIDAEKVDRMKKTVQLLLNLGVDLNSRYSGDYEKLSLWAKFVCKWSHYALGKSVRHIFWSMTEAFLQHGAEPPIWYTSYSNSRGTISNLIDTDGSLDSNVIQTSSQIVKSESSSEDELDKPAKQSYLRIGNEEFRLTKSDANGVFRQHWPAKMTIQGEFTTLYDLLEMYPADVENADTIRDLLDRAKVSKLVSENESNLSTTIDQNPEVYLRQKNIDGGENRQSQWWKSFQSFANLQILPWILFGKKLS